VSLAKQFRAASLTRRLGGEVCYRLPRGSHKSHPQTHKRQKIAQVSKRAQTSVQVEGERSKETETNIRIASQAWLSLAPGPICKEAS